MNQEPIAFGPVPSRRFGLSLGINFFREKTCNYRCIYCQIPDQRRNTGSNPFYSIKEIAEDFWQKLENLKSHQILPQVITLISAGEPTLFPFLSEVVNEIKPAGIPLALITNASRFSDPSLQTKLEKIDFVSVKVDTAQESLWKKINRPAVTQNFLGMQNDILKFREIYPGILYTETMLVKDYNDKKESLNPVLERIQAINPHRAYFSIPLRPPVCKWVQKPDFERLKEIRQEVKTAFPNSFFLFNDIKKGIVAFGDILEDLKATSLIHPLKEEAVFFLLREKNIPVEQLTQWVEQGFFELLSQDGERYYRARKEDIG